MRRTLAIALLFALSALWMPGPAFAQTLTVRVNGAVVPHAYPALVSGQLVALVSPVADAMGVSYHFDPVSNRVTLRYAGTSLAFTIGNQIGYQDSQPVWLPVAPYLVEGKPKAPMWWLAVRLRSEVSFSQSQGTLAITTPYRRGNTGPPAANHPLFLPGYRFPYPAGTSYTFPGDTWADPRGYSGREFSHEGNDILAARGVPIAAAASGVITRLGWNRLGGYRVTIRLSALPDYHFYYAHFDRYAPGLYVGKHVAAGDLLGYTGNTGEGPERTEGKFPTHLHFGIYGPGFQAINPYYFLRFWERL